MDERDLTILKAVMELETDNLEEIAAETGIANSTIHYRLERLQEQGIIKNDLWEFDLEKLGLTITVISNIIAEYEEDYHHDVGEKIADVPGVNKVYWTMGEIDFIAIAHLHDQSQVQNLFSKYGTIDEIKRTNSTYVIDTIKDESFSIRDYDLSQLKEFLDDR